MKRLAALIWLAVVLVAAGYLSVRLYHGLNFRTDLMALLPREQQNSHIQSANDAVTKMLTRRVVILVGDKNRDAVRAAATEIRNQFNASDLFDIAMPDLDKDHLRQIGSFYYPYRAGLLADEDRDLLISGKGDDVAMRALAQTYGMFGMANGKLLQADPFLLMPNFLTHLPVPLSRFAPDEGMLSLRDGDKIWVLITAQIKGEAFALDMQKKVVNVYDRAAASQKSLYPYLDILHLGAVFFAKAGAEQAMSETSSIGVASTIGIIILMLALFRAARPLLLGLLVMGVGIGVALAASLWLFGDLHVVALLFGVSLMGVSVDYSLQYCTEIFASPAGAPLQRLKRVRVGIILGAATTVIGYLTLYLAPFPGLHQIAIFSAIGLVASCLTVLLWLPALDNAKPAAHGKMMIRVAQGVLDFWQTPKYRVCRKSLLVVLVAVAIAGFSRLHSDDDVRHMQSLPAGLVAEQKQIQNLTGMTGNGQFFLVQAADDEGALQREEQLAERLRILVNRHSLSGFQSVAQYIPSMARQAGNRILQRDGLYQPWLVRQAVALNLSTPPQTVDLTQPLLKLSDLRAADGPMEWISNLSLSPEDAGVMHVVMLDGVSDVPALKSAAEGIEGVRLIDPTGDFSDLFGKYRQRAVVLILLSALLMLPLLVWRYGFAQGLWVMVPPSLAVFLALALRGLCGAAFTFFDAMGLVLILSIGVDYAVFFAETSEQRRPVTMLAVAAAAATALMSFGLLALSGVAAVHNFGATMSLGVLLSFLFAPLACFGGKNGIPWRHLLSVACLFMLCGCADIRQEKTHPQTVTFAPQVTLTMPDPATLGRSVEVTQLVAVHYGDQIFSFEAHIGATPDHFLLVGLDMMGRKMIRIDWTSSGIVYEKAEWVPVQLQPENILADIVLLYWPQNVVQQALSTNAVLVAHAKHREILSDGKKIWQADYRPAVKGDLWSGPLHYSNKAWGYVFDIQSAEVAP